MTEITRENVIITLLKSILLFCFIYEIQPIGVPDFLTSRKLAFLFCFILYSYQRGFILISNDIPYGRTVLSEVFKISVIVLLWTFFVTGLSMISGSWKGTLILSRTFLFVLIEPVGCVLMQSVFNNAKNFAQSLLIATLMQSLIVFVDFFSSSARSFLYHHFELNTNYDYLTTFRAAGLGAGESMLSIDLFLGVIAACYLMVSGKRNLLYICCSALIIFATSLVGATGFFASIILLIITIIYMTITSKSIHAIKNLGMIVFMSIIALFILPNVIQLSSSGNTDFQIYDKIANLKSTGILESSTVTTLRTQTIAPISLETIIGTGLLRGTTGTGIVSNSDSGYLQAYFGYGLIGALLFYFYLYKNFLFCIKSKFEKNSRFILYAVFLITLVLEYKEPYIHYYALPFTILMLGVLPDSYVEDIYLKCRAVLLRRDV